MGDADQRSKQIRGVKIFSQIAAVFRAPHQFIDRPLDQAARTFIKSGRASFATCKMRSRFRCASLRGFRWVAMMERGVHVSVMRLPQVHDTVKQGLVTGLIAVARAKSVSAYIGEGKNRWPAAHVTDVARLYRLALAKFSARTRRNRLRSISASMGSLRAGMLKLRVRKPGNNWAGIPRGPRSSPISRTCVIPWSE
jgi:hypothetical protein